MIPTRQRIWRIVHARPGLRRHFRFSSPKPHIDFVMNNRRIHLYVPMVLRMTCLSAHCISSPCTHVPFPSNLGILLKWLAVTMRRCLHDCCTKRPSFNFEGYTTAAYCKKHSEDGMVTVVSRQCTHESCTKTPSFNAEGRTPAMYCKKHAEEGMVDVLSRRCSIVSCMTRSNFNFAGYKTPAYCKDHARKGMVNIRKTLCSSASCTRRPSFNAEGTKAAAYCKRHAESGMINVRSRRCVHESCSKRPSYNTEGGTTGIYCRKHATEGMVDVRHMLCSHEACKKKPNWGISTASKPTVCVDHKNDVVAGHVVNFQSMCKVADCREVSRWGVCGQQPTHCLEHGPLEAGLVCIVVATRGSGTQTSSIFSNSALTSPACRVKTE